MNRDEILDVAKALIVGDRHEQHGEAHQNFARIAGMWSLILNADVEPHQVALCMAALKISRATSNPNNDDSFVDGCGYLALAGELVGDLRPSQSQH